MIIELNPSKGMGLMQVLAQLTYSTIIDNVLQFPPSFGSGYMKTIPLGAEMNMFIISCGLVEDLTLKIPPAINSDFVTFSFRNVFSEMKMAEKNSYDGYLLPSVQVSSGNIKLEMVFSANRKINNIIINIHNNLLKGLINQSDENSFISTIISREEEFLYEEIVSLGIREVAVQILRGADSTELLDFYYKLKAEEMIYLFFVDLTKRKNIEKYPINNVDANRIYLVRDKIISDLTVVPKLPTLAKLAHMSESKINRLFKQVFGTTIYNYHQKMRIMEAANRIKNSNLSISEVGYQLGFTNLSHFTRLFERYIGMKPKKYSRQ